MEKIVIDIMQSGQSPVVLNMIQEFYWRNYEVKPDGLLDVCLVAQTRDKIAGVIGLEFSKAGSPFEFEQFFDFDFSMLPYPRSLSVNFGRWAATDQNVGKGLAFACVKYALDLGKRQAVACSKPLVLRLLRRDYKLRFNVFSTLIKPKAKENNFFSKLPKPFIYSWKLEDWYKNLKQLPSFVKINI